MTTAVQTQAKAAPVPVFSTTHSNLLQRKCACGGTPGPSGECEECHKKRLTGTGGFQPKLAVSWPGDQWEQEADRMAEAVVSGVQPDVKLSPISGHTISQSAARQGNGASGEVPSSVHKTLRAPGRPLDPAVRTFMEDRFAYDFNQVRIHDDRQAAESARQVSALAYTIGRDVVFGARQYAPHSLPGQRLLAHELTHVVQQGAATAPQASLSIGEVSDPAEADAERVAEQVMAGNLAAHMEDGAPILRRQPREILGEEDWDRMVGEGSGEIVDEDEAGLPVPARTTEAGAAPAGWQDCPPDQVPGLNNDLAQAVDWVGEAVRDLQREERPAHTTGALERYLSTDPGDVADEILPRLTRMQTELRGGPVNFRCRTQQQCAEIVPTAGNASAISTYPITICDNYFNVLREIAGGATSRPATLIHEAAHHAGLPGDTYEFTWPFPELQTGQRLQNADSMTAFVLTNHAPSLSPVRGPTGLTVRAGASTLSGTGPRSPRFVVTAGFDTTLARRIFHFMDLRLGARIDVDESGSIIGTVSLGPRLFAPVTLTSVPVYLDLQAGFVGGNDPTQVSDASRILGISTEARLGFQSGHFGGSISYRRIWNLMQSDEDIDQVTVAGEIDF